MNGANFQKFGNLRKSWPQEIMTMNLADHCGTAALLSKCQVIEVMRLNMTLQMEMKVEGMGWLPKGQLSV